MQILQKSANQEIRLAKIQEYLESSIILMERAKYNYGESAC